MENLKSYIEENKDRFLEELFGLIRIPSISSQSEHKEDMLKAAEYLTLCEPTNMRQQTPRVVELRRCEMVQPGAPRR